MFTEIQPASIEECRSFIVALGIAVDDKAQPYITAQKRGRYWVYCNSFVKHSFFRNKNVLDTAQRCFSLLTKINDQERFALLENLEQRLAPYKERVKKSMWIQTLCGLVYRETFRRIDSLRAGIKAELEAMPPYEKNAALGQEAQELVQQINSRHSSFSSMSDLKNKKEVNIFVDQQLKQNAVWLEQAMKLFLNECTEVYKNIFALQKELRFRSLQKKALIETKQLLKKVNNELLNHEAEELTQRITSIKGSWDRISLCTWVIFVPYGTVKPLLANRFFKLTTEDAQSPEAVEVSKEITECIEFSHRLENFMTSRNDFRDMMKKHENELKQAAEDAKENSTLLAAIERLNRAVEQNAPWEFFDLKVLPPDLRSFEREARKAAPLVHPDKNKDHLKAAETLTKIHNEIVTWIKLKNYLV